MPRGSNNYLNQIATRRQLPRSVAPRSRTKICLFVPAVALGVRVKSSYDIKELALVVTGIDIHAGLDVDPHGIRRFESPPRPE